MLWDRRFLGVRVARKLTMSPEPQAAAYGSARLAEATQGSLLEIKALDGGCGATRRLAELGLRIGSRVEVLHRRPGGAVIIALGGARLAVGGGLASKVIVSVIEESDECAAGTHLLEVRSS
jgi:Fe2+ transport system protein FeoA